LRSQGPARGRICFRALPFYVPGLLRAETVFMI